MIDDVAQEKIMEAYQKSVLQEAIKDLGAYNKLYANLQKAITNALRQAK
jgi:hypothetical protein